MKYHSVMFFFLTILAEVLTAPWPPDIPLCSEECAVTGTPKYRYVAETTYLYSYFGRSHIYLKGVEGAVTQTSWKTEVELTWLSPCDMAITIKNPSVDGSPGLSDTFSMERYPLVVAITDGIVQYVCSHPDEDTWSLNIKKGIASLIQNTLPTHSPINSGLNITETDVLGTCPTQYSVDVQGGKVFVTKSKNHRLCHDRYLSQSENPIAWLHSPLPVDQSKSLCQQEILHGIPVNISCQDENIIRPAYGSYKYIRAFQEATLEFQSDNGDPSSSIANLGEHLVKRSLLYDHQTPNKDSSVMILLEDTLRQICEKTLETISHDTGQLISQAIQYMRQGPDKAIEEMLKKIRRGHFCSAYKKLESLFLDAVSFVHESGAVKVMIDELLKGDVPMSRNILYIAALHLTPRPTLHAVESLKGLFAASRPSPLTTLAAASMVNTYCRLNPGCEDKAAVMDILNILGTKAERECASVNDPEAQKSALAYLKALGNMGVINIHYARSLIRCMERGDSEISVRVAAAQAFRNTKCHEETTNMLSGIATDPNFETEVRIASYLEAIRCADEENLKMILRRITKERNTQVRGFILSHLQNIQSSTSLGKENLREMMMNTVLPRNYSSDFRKFSSNIDLSYYSRSSDVGAGMENDIVYSPGLFVPRSVALNTTVVIGGVSLNLGEFGIQVKGIDPLIDKLFGPDGYFQLPLNRILSDIIAFSTQKSSRIINEIHQILRQRRSINVSVIRHFLDKLYGGVKARLPQIVTFLRFMGQEVFFSFVEKDIHETDVDRLIELFFNKLRDYADDLKSLNTNLARTAHFGLDYSIPTIQGVPLKLNLEGTAALGLKLTGKIDLLKMIYYIKNTDTSLSIRPSLSADLNAFIGYDSFIVKKGLKMKTSFYNSEGISVNVKTKNGNEIEMNVDLPDKTELLNLESEVFLMKIMRGGPEEKIMPPSVTDVRIQRHACSHILEPVLDLKFCYAVNVPNIFLTEGFPLGQKSLIKLSLDKSDPSIRGYHLVAHLHNADNYNTAMVHLKLHESVPPREAHFTLSYFKGPDSCKMYAAMETHLINGGMWVTLIKHAEEKSMEVVAKYKSNHSEYTRKIKLNMHTSGDSSEKEVDIKLYASSGAEFSSTSLVSECKLMKRFRNHNVSFDAIVTTSNALKSYIDLHYVIGVDLTLMPFVSIPVLLNVRECEFYLDFKNLSITSFLRKLGDDQYNSALKLKYQSLELLSLRTTHTFEGSYDQSFSVLSVFSAKMNRKSYTTDVDFFYETLKMGLSTKFSCSGDSTAIFVFNSLLSKEGETAIGQILVDIPKHMNPILFEITFKDQRDDSYIIQSTLKHGKQLLVEMDGPISFTATQALLAFKADLKATTLTAGPLKIYMVVEFSGIKQCVSFNVKDQTREAIALKYCVDAASPRETIYGIEVFIPTITDSEVYIIITNTYVSVIVENVMFPRTPSPRIYKLLGELSFINKTLKADLTWDGDRNPDNKFGVDLALVSSSTNSRHVTISGYIVFIAEIFHVRVTTTSEGNGESLQLGRGVILHLTTPTHKTLTVKANLKIEQQASSSKLEADFRLKDLAKKQYRFNGIYNIQKLNTPHSYQISSESVYTSPAGHENSLQLTAKHQITPVERILYLKVKASNHALEEPLAVEIAVENEGHSSRMDFTVSAEKPTILMLWDLQVYPQGAVRNVNVEIESESFLRLLKNIRILIGSGVQTNNMGAVKLAETGTPMLYKLNYTKPATSNYHVSIISPSRKMEGELSLGLPQYSLTFYPDRDRSEAKYEFASKYKRSLDQQQIEWHNHVSHPSLPRDMLVTVLYQSIENSIRGTLEVDIFPDSADKITASLETSRVSTNTLQIEVILLTRVLNDNPRVTITTSYASHLIGLDLLYQTSHRAHPSFIVAAKYEVISSQSVVLALIIENEGHRVLEISGSTQVEKYQDCDGLRAEATAVVPVTGVYNIQLKVCKPAFLQLTLHEQKGVTNNYTVNMGLQEPNNFELGLTEVNHSNSEIQNIIMLKSTLVSPTQLNFDVIYRRQQANRVMNSFTAEIQKVFTAIDWWFLEIWTYFKREAASKKILYPPPKMINIARETQEQLIAIYQDLVKDGIIPRYKIFVQFLEGPMMTYFRESLKWGWEHVTSLRARVQNRFLTEIYAWEQEFQELSKGLIKGTNELVDLIETGKVPEEFVELLMKLEQTFMLQAIKRRVDILAKEYPEEYQGLQEGLDRFKAALETDITRIRVKVLEMPTTQRLTMWMKQNMRHWTQWEAKHLLDYCMDRLTFLSIETEENHMNIKIPLHQPLYSLSQAVQEAVPLNIIGNIIISYYVYIPSPISDMVWSYYNLLPHRISDMFPPFNRSAMIVGDTEILTFDGAWLRLPRSKCKVLLASYMLNELIVEYPLDEAPPQYTMKVSGTAVVVQPNYIVTINGHQVTKEHTIHGLISVIITPLKIQISGPFVTFRIAHTARTSSLEVSGWAFGHIAGILGTYDGEVGNDWMMPSGARATSMQQLVSSWQEDLECETTSIITVRPSLSRVIRCNAMLNIRSRCNPVVDPQLFVEMCFVGHSACDAARAYRNLCSEKGVLALVPMGC